MSANVGDDGQLSVPARRAGMCGDLRVGRQASWCWFRGCYFCKTCHWIMAGRPPTTCGAKQIYSPGLLTCGQKPATELFLAVVKSGQATKESKGLQFELLPASHCRYWH